MSVMNSAMRGTRQALLRLSRDTRRPVQQTVEAGPGAIFSLAQLLRSNRLKKPLVVVSRGEYDRSEQLTRTLEESDFRYAFWGRLQPDPTVEDAESIRLAWISEICDCFVVMGDDRAINAVKAAAARAACRNKSLYQLEGYGRLRMCRTPPVVAIPTLAGSGAESFCRASVLDDQGIPVILEDPALAPAYVILDTELMDRADRPATASAVMEGVCLAVEAGLSDFGDDTALAMAGDALGGFLRSAVPCWNSGGTAEERAELMNASVLAGQAASRAGMGYIHALCEAAVLETGLSFGEVCGAILPAALKKYGGDGAEDLAALAERAGAADTGTRLSRADTLIAAIRRMSFRMGLPDALPALPSGKLTDIAAMAAARANLSCACPVYWNASQCAEVLRSACSLREI